MWKFVAAPFATIGWVVTASAILCFGTGRWSYFRFPYWQWPEVAAEPNLGWWVNLWVVIGGVAPLAAAGLVGLIVYRVSTYVQRFRGLRRPIGGGIRPIVLGPTDNYGHAAILDDDETERRYSSPDGIVIGEMLAARPGRGRLVVQDCGDTGGHGMMVIGTGGGKSSSFATMIYYWPGSAVVLDPKRELGALLRRALEAQGRRVFLLNPDDPNTGVNVLAQIDHTSSSAGIQVMALVDLIFPDATQPAKAPTDPYFEPSAKSLCVAILADLIASDRPAAEKNLRTFRSLVIVREDHMPRMMQTIHAKSKSQLARDLAGTLMKVTKRQFSGIYGQAVQGTQWLSDPGLANVCSVGAFNATDILDGNTVIFLQPELAVAMHSPGVARVLIGSMMDVIYRADTTLEQNAGFFHDESWILGRMAIQKQAILYGRSRRITLVLAYHSIGDVRNAWGEREGDISGLMNNLSWVAFAGVKDDATAKQVSESFGKISVLSWSEGTNTGQQRPRWRGFGSRSKGNATNVREEARALFLPQEVQQSDPDIAYVIAGRDRMRIRLAFWWRRRELRSQLCDERKRGLGWLLGRILKW